MPHANDTVTAEMRDGRLTLSFAPLPVGGVDLNHNRPLLPGVTMSLDVEKGAWNYSRLHDTLRAGNMAYAQAFRGVFADNGRPLPNERPGVFTTGEGPATSAQLAAFHDAEHRIEATGRRVPSAEHPGLDVMLTDSPAILIRTSVGGQDRTIIIETDEGLNSHMDPQHVKVSVLNEDGTLATGTITPPQAPPDPALTNLGMAPPPKPGL